MMLHGLSKRTHGHAWFIVGAPTQKERDWWCKQLGGHVVLLNPGIQECKRRALDRGTPLALQGIDQWVARSERHWHPPTHKSRIGVDGWIDREDIDEADIILHTALHPEPRQ